MTSSAAPSPASGSFGRRKTLLPFLLTAAFLALAVASVLHHEMWRDEWQAWLLAKDHPTLGALAKTMRYEGHQALWHLCLYILRHVVPNPLSMQLFHVALAATTVYLVARFAPFTPVQKVLFAFGYFPVYEYAVISRNYGIGALLAFAFCAAYPVRLRNPILVAALLFLLAQTNLFGLILALALVVPLLIEAAIDREARQQLLSHRGRVGVAAGIYLAGIVLSVYQIIPPKDSGLAGGITLGIHLGTAAEALGAVWRSFVPIPQFQLHFWNTNFIPGIVLQALLSLGIVGCCLALFRRDLPVLGLYLAGMTAAMIFMYCVYLGSIRHQGYLFLLFLACLWLRQIRLAEGRGVDPARASGGGLSRRGSLALSGLFALHVVGGAMATYLDWRYPFTDGGQVSAYLAQHHLANAPIVGDSDAAASTVSGYLGRPVYHASSKRWASYVVWNNRRSDRVEDVFPIAQQVAQDQGRDAVVLLNYRPDSLPAGVRELAEFRQSIVKDEEYYLYQVRQSGALADTPMPRLTRGELRRASQPQ